MLFRVSIFQSLLAYSFLKYVFLSFIGKYGEVPKLPFVPGNECVAEVVECGEGVKNVKPGDRIIPFASLLGTWRTHALFNENDIFKVPASISNVDAATITVNPSTAFRMLRDFVHLKAGDVVIQNGANSAVGQSVIQLCRIWNLKSVNVVRNRANIEELKNTLKGLGATEVFTEEEIRVTPIFKSGELSAPKIGLNCVGGKSATNILRYLAPHGQLITYGAMSRESLTIPNAALIFKDIAFRGYWMSRWSKESSDTERKQMYEELFQLMSSGEFKPAIHKLISLDEYKEALARLADVKGMTGHKYLFSFNQ